ncbi:MAG: hypothetical protein ACXWV8_02185 [Chitinophagaceae bacterium]
MDYKGILIIVYQHFYYTALRFPALLVGISSLVLIVIMYKWDFTMLKALGMPVINKNSFSALLIR